ncbi:MAG TPA: FAD-binding protein [Myxococcota bacterium]|nr:FAD-binding protein [Myxococcota bacterium]
MLSYRDNVAFQNEHGTIKRTLPRVAVPTNLDDNGQTPAQQPWKAGLAALRKLVQEARTAGTSLTPLGSAWSLSPAHDPTGWLVETKFLNEIPAIGLAAPHVEPGYAGDPAGLLFAQCGNTVARLHLELARKGRSLRTSGASCGQTIAGATATGTHGSAFDVGALHDTIVGLHVVGEDGRVFWIERKSRPVVSQAFATLVEAQLRRESDDLFNAAVVSFGAFGLIHAVLVETDPLFLLKRYRQRVPLDEVMDGIAWSPGGGLVFPAQALPRGRDQLFHFDLLINPNDVAKKGAIVQTIYRSGTVADYHYDDQAAKNLGKGDDVLGVVSHLIETLQAFTNPEVQATIKKLEKQRYPDTGMTPEVGVLGELFPRVEFRSGGDSIEIGVDVRNAKAALEACLHVVRQPLVAYPGLMGVRFVKGSAATLAFTRFPMTCTIELPSVRTKKTPKLYARIFDRLRAKKIPFTQHWGQTGEYTEPRVRQMHGDAAVDAWRAQRAAFLGPTGAARFRSTLVHGANLG